MVDVTKNIEYLMNVGTEAETITAISGSAGRIVQDITRNERNSYTNPLAAAGLGGRLQRYKTEIEKTLKRLTPSQKGLKAGLTDLYAELLKLEFSIKRYLGKEHGVPAARKAVKDEIKNMYSMLA